ncbi:hypothetical protein BC628DRAFT_1096697 [Trametes gibbosa]|nr:hypothetical protein BC628DRAFT_1096697 [Trametes gibbosa]
MLRAGGPRRGSESPENVRTVFPMMREPNGPGSHPGCLPPVGLHTRMPARPREIGVPSERNKCAPAAARSLDTGVSGKTCCTSRRERSSGLGEHCGFDIGHVLLACTYQQVHFTTAVSSCCAQRSLAAAATDGSDRLSARSRWLCDIAAPILAPVLATAAPSLITDPTMDSRTCSSAAMVRDNRRVPQRGC